MTAPSSSTPDLLKFGAFELDRRARQLRRAGRLIHVPPQPLQVLTFLVERRGEVCTREELRQLLWPTDVYVDFDRSLNKAIAALRDALADSAESPRYVETVPRVGYRFIAPLNGVSEASPKQVVVSRRAVAWVATAYVLLVAVAFVVWVRAGTAVPHIVGSIQLSHSAEPKVTLLLTDGRRLFFSEASTNGRATPVQLSVDGGDSVALPTTLENAFLTDLSPDGSEFLALSTTLAHGEQEPTLWVLPASGASARRIGDIRAHGAAWSPDARQVVFVAGHDVLVANRDGSQARTLATLPDSPDRPRWSPDGSVIRFDLHERGDGSSIWEIAPGGGSPHPLLPGWSCSERRPRGLDG